MGGGDSGIHIIGFECTNQGLSVRHSGVAWKKSQRHWRWSIDRGQQILNLFSSDLHKWPWIVLFDYHWRNSVSITSRELIDLREWLAMKRKTAGMALVVVVRAEKEESGLIYNFSFN